MILISTSRSSLIWTFKLPLTSFSKLSSPKPAFASLSSEALSGVPPVTPLRALPASLVSGTPLRPPPALPATPLTALRMCQSEYVILKRYAVLVDLVRHARCFLSFFWRFRWSGRFNLLLMFAFGLLALRRSRRPRQIFFCTEEKNGWLYLVLRKRSWEHRLSS
jgi:hypothetical protein